MPALRFKCALGMGESGVRANITSRLWNLLMDPRVGRVATVFQLETIYVRGRCLFTLQGKGRGLPPRDLVEAPVYGWDLATPFPLFQPCVMEPYDEMSFAYEPIPTDPLAVRAVSLPMPPAPSPPMVAFEGDLTFKEYGEDSLAVTLWRSLGGISEWAKLPAGTEPLWVEIAQLACSVGRITADELAVMIEHLPPAPHGR